ncbi:MAG TPA: DNA mismatch repair endonuclease MutL [Gemmatimonadaceae bacterium]|nr:DNA mismatch repair endonuclease MutL [Gemmatimonadaceae bacterium]
MSAGGAEVRRASRIAVLPSAVADQIAAGEVVERPASAVKELVENALDAGATTIEVTLEDGGRTLIRVADDGCGMDREELLLALERHATSKIRSAADLVGVTSFGFRGEALPAIASVSRLEISSSIDGGDGTIVRAAGGAVTEVSATTRRTGTTVSVGQLFYNVPARLKFLRGARSEWRAAVESLIATALCRRDLRLGVTHDGKSALTLPPASSMRARVAGIWGGTFAERFIEADDVSGPVHVSGLVERPADVGTASRRIFLSVNGRPVRDAGMVRAAESAYRSTIVSGVRPSLFLEIVLPADVVDVNVHPAKAEVRFHDRWHIERAVERAVRRALGEPSSAAFVGGARSWTYTPNAALAPEPVDVEVLASRAAPAEGLFSPAPNATPSADIASDVGAERESARRVDVPPLLQLRRTYLMFERGDGVVLIDQHSAHERVLFEQFMNVLERGAAPSQRLLFPATLHLGPAEGDAFESNREALARLGFEVEPFGGHSIIVSAVPMPHPRFDALRCLRDTFDALTGDRLPSAAARHERLAATVACKAAIKGGDTLSLAEMQALYVGLAATTLPAHDVHGRSTIVQITWDELDRRFGRK